MISCYILQDFLTGKRLVERVLSDGSRSKGIEISADPKDTLYTRGNTYYFWSDEDAFVLLKNKAPKEVLESDSKQLPLGSIIFKGDWAKYRLEDIEEQIEDADRFIGCDDIRAAYLNEKFFKVELEAIENSMK